MKLGMLLHFLLNQADRFCWYIKPKVIKTGVLSKKGKERIAYSTTKFYKLASFFSSGIDIFEKRNWLNLSFEVSSIFKEAAFMEFVKFIPYFLCLILSLLIELLWLYNFVLY